MHVQIEGVDRKGHYQESGGLQSWERNRRGMMKEEEQVFSQVFRENIFVLQ